VPRRAAQREKNMFTYGVCPKCKNNLIIKKKDFHLFIGCSNWPACQFTRNINGIENYRLQILKDVLKKE